jgi:excinuclease UvrABC nuclease subunit
MAEHDENIARTRAFLSGESSTVFADLERDMRERAQSQEFEEAQKIKETIVALR